MTKGAVLKGKLAILFFDLKAPGALNGENTVFENPLATYRGFDPLDRAGAEFLLHSLGRAIDVEKRAASVVGAIPRLHPLHKVRVTRLKVISTMM